MGIALELKEWQKEYLSPFCLEECVESCCCREKTAIFMTEKQFRKAYGIKAGEEIPQSKNYFLAGWRKDDTPEYAVSIHPTEQQPHCQAYNPETRICNLENDKPKGCRSYPILLRTPNIYLISGCSIARGKNSAIKKLEQIAKEHSHKLKLLTARRKLEDLLKYRAR